MDPGKLMRRTLDQALAAAAAEEEWEQCGELLERMIANEVGDVLARGRSDLVGRAVIRAHERAEDVMADWLADEPPLEEVA